MKDDKAFSMVEMIMGLMIMGSLDVAEALLDPIGIGFLLMPAEIGVSLLTTMWFLYKGGSRMEVRIIVWLAGNVAELAPLIGILPMRTFVFVVSVHLTNKARERDAAGEGSGGEGEGGIGEEGENEYDEDYAEESPETPEETHEEELPEEEEEEYPMAA